MSVRDWCIHKAGKTLPGVMAGLFEVEAFASDDGFIGYVLRMRRELTDHEQRIASIRTGKIPPTVVRVAVRKTFAEVDRLRVKWEREAQAKP